jgi:uncharacterized protein YdaU (DUF1376 family)
MREKERKSASNNTILSFYAVQEKEWNNKYMKKITKGMVSNQVTVK